MVEMEAAFHIHSLDVESMVRKRLIIMNLSGTGRAMCWILA